MPSPLLVCRILQNYLTAHKTDPRFIEHRVALLPRPRRRGRLIQILEVVARQVIFRIEL